MTAENGFSILVVDDEKSMRESLHTVLSRRGYHVETASGGHEAVEKARASTFHLLITDLAMPDMDGIETFRVLKRLHPGLDGIIVTGQATLSSAIEAIRIGVYDYIIKPVEMDIMIRMVERALEHSRLKSENERLHRELGRQYGLESLVGKSARMLEVYGLVHRVAQGTTTVLLRGESGTGKELVARAVHYASSRRNEAFVVVSCAALPETLLESELFGHEKGAFTGALGQKPGLFELADGGTLFLDEIGDLSAATQTKLLRVVQEKEFQRVGGTTPIRVDVRFVSATNRDLEEGVRKGSFREDLYYRINVVPIDLPPLRERREDIPLLAKHFLDKHRGQSGVKHISEEAMDLLKRYGWPGNVRELENAVERGIVLCDGDALVAGDLPDPLRAPPAAEEEARTMEGLSLKKAKDRFEASFVKHALERTRGNVSLAARTIGLSRRHFYEKLKVLGLDLEELREEPPS